MAYAAPLAAARLPCLVVLFTNDVMLRQSLDIALSICSKACLLARDAAYVVRSYFAHNFLFELISHVTWCVTFLSL